MLDLADSILRNGLVLFANLGLLNTRFTQFDYAPTAIGNPVVHISYVSPNRQSSVPRPQSLKARFILRNSLKISAASFFRHSKACFASQNPTTILLNLKRKLCLMSYIRLHRNAAGGVTIESCSSLRQTRRHAETIQSNALCS
ncbi:MULTISPECIES: hypothetical protein [Paraburkholderia]|uniref:hypothetical protein n=1 Tax=Paraburkholderia TaxID=1822464 RepID=UPI00101A3730|nr:MULTISPECIES: hypothetical protein [Paraburkholderia]